MFKDLWGNSWKLHFLDSWDWVISAYDVGVDDNDDNDSDHNNDVGDVDQKVGDVDT